MNYNNQTLNMKILLFIGFYLLYQYWR